MTEQLGYGLERGGATTIGTIAGIIDTTVAATTDALSSGHTPDARFRPAVYAAAHRGVVAR